jgi:hypothetical protein
LSPFSICRSYLLGTSIISNASSVGKMTAGGSRPEL